MIRKGHTSLASMQIVHGVLTHTSWSLDAAEPTQQVEGVISWLQC